jgi:diguanylate cyclase (GGDEF)-like protein
MSGALILLVQAICYFAVMGALFRARHRLGTGVFVCVLGVMHFIETYLGAVFFIQLPLGLTSPGSAALFSGKLAMILLLYMREDAETVRQPIYGLLIGNLLTVALAWMLHLYTPVAMFGAKPDLKLLDDLGLLMIWGTVLLLVDSVGLILLYERLGRSMGSRVVLTATASLMIVLSFDQVMFYAVLRLVNGAPVSALVGGWVAKLACGLVYSSMIVIYLRWFEGAVGPTSGQPIGDLFERLTYRGRYERLIERTAIDPLTGVFARGRFEEIAQLTISQAIAEARPISLELVDIDHFKRVNDEFGHLRGDEVLRHVGRILRDSVRANDKVFRYGGEEFVILCEGMPHEAAVAHAHRVKLAIPSQLGEACGIPTTISIGVATAPADGEHLLQILECADSRLYAAKRGGRNAVVGDLRVEPLIESYPTTDAMQG